jgi:hypothetical protein
MQCFYDPATNEISYWYPIITPPPGAIVNPNQQPIKSIINLSNDTHLYDEIVKQLTDVDNTIFLQISAQLRITDQLLLGLMKSKYYTTVFLPYILSFGEIGTLGSDFIPTYYMFSAICVPYSIADYIAFLNPKYKLQLTKTNVLKDLMRLLLIVPGLPVTLLLYIFVPNT